jgi:hypothetical protein
MSSWQKAVESRLGDRADLGKEGLHRRFWPELSKSDVIEALELIETECDVRPGLLRPADRLAALFEPPKTKNPFRWLEYQSRSSDGSLEISYRLGKRLRVSNTADQWRDRVDTVDDFVRAWCASAATKNAGRDHA